MRYLHSPLPHWSIEPTKQGEKREDREAASYQRLITCYKEGVDE